MQKYVIFGEKESQKKLSKYIIDSKIRDHCHYAGKYREAAHTICILKFNVLNETPVVFHNGSNYFYCFVRKELANGFEGIFECLGENTEEYKTFFILIEKRNYRNR